MCEVTLSVVPTTSGGKWRYNAVATPTTSAEGAADDGAATFKAFSDYGYSLTDSGGLTAPTKMLYSALYDTFYVLGYQEGKVFVHPRDDYTQDFPTEIDPDGETIRTPSQGSGCMSREGKYIWLSGYTTPYGVRAIDLSDNSVTNFTTTGDLVAVAAYEEASTQYVLLYNAGTSYLELYEADFGTPTLGSYVRRWNLNPISAESKAGVWDNNDRLWFAPTDAFKSIDPLIDGTIRQYSYPTSYSRCTPAYDTTRHQFYIRIGTGIDAVIYRFAGWDDGTDNSGGFDPLIFNFEASALYHDSESDVLFGLSDTLSKVHRYTAADGSLIDCTSATTSSAHQQINLNLELWDDVFYMDDCGYFLARNSNNVAAIRARFRGKAVTYYEATALGSASLASANGIQYSSTLNEVWLVDGHYNDTGPYKEAAWAVFDAATGTLLDHFVWNSTYVANVSTNSGPVTHIIEAWDQIIAHASDPNTSGAIAPFTWKMSDRSEVGTWRTALGAPEQFLYAVNTSNNTAMVCTQGAVVEIWSLDSTTHLPDTLITTHTPASSMWHGPGHVDADGNFWARTGTRWIKCNGSTITQYVYDSDGAVSDPYMSCYDSLRNCIYYWSHPDYDKLKKIDCYDGTISTVATFQASIQPYLYGQPLEYAASLDKVVVKHGGTTSTLGFAVYAVDPTNGHYDMITVPDLGGADLFSPNVCYDSTNGVLWSYASQAAGFFGTGESGIMKVVVDDLLVGVGSSAEDLGQIYTCQTRKLSATKVRVDTILLGPPHIRKSAPFSLTVKYT